MKCLPQTEEDKCISKHLFNILYKVFILHMDSALNMDSPNIFKSNKFYQHMALHIREEKLLKR